MVILHKVDPLVCKLKISGFYIALIIVLNVMINLNFLSAKRMFYYFGWMHC